MQYLRQLAEGHYQDIIESVLWQYERGECKALYVCSMFVWKAVMKYVPEEVWRKYQGNEVKFYASFGENMTFFDELLKQTNWLWTYEFMLWNKS